MLTICQYFHPAGGLCQPTLFLYYVPVKGKAVRSIYFHFNLLSTIQFLKEFFFGSLLILVKLTLIYKKTKMALYDDQHKTRITYYWLSI
jgi:hypothetical protein